MLRWDSIGLQCMFQQPATLCPGVLELMGSIGWTPNVYNEELFRVFEYGAMLVILSSTLSFS